MTYSFPCTDLSLAGKRAGMKKGSGTRSGLLWEVERLLNETQELPDILIMENVPQVLRAEGWYDWCFFLESKGYSNYAEVLNAKNFGIPQNRERCFMVSILGEYNYEFPKNIKLDYVLGDFLEKEVDEKYNISEKMKTGMLKTKFNSYKYDNLNMSNKKVCKTLLTSTGERAPLLVEKQFIATYQFSKSDKYMKGKDRINLNKNYADTILTSPKEAIIIKKDTKNYIEWEEKGKFDIDCRAYKTNGVAPTTTTTTKPINKVLLSNMEIRRMTPRECFRLMGVLDEDSNKLTCSDTQKYKQAGNSIVTTCLMAIYSQLYDNCDYKYYIKKLVNELRE